MRVLVAAGTRPELVKLEPVVAALRHRGVLVDVLLTGQHDDVRMTSDGLGRSELAPMQWQLHGDGPTRTGELLARAMALFAARAPEWDAVVVQGDTTTAHLVALAARNTDLPVAHVEAGLRSNNEHSAEERNRRGLAHLATVHFAPTPGAAANLTAERVPLDRIHVVGNPICDVLATSGIRQVPVAERAGVLFTAHRASNVDDPTRLATIVDIACRATRYGLVHLPLHPRTERQLLESGLGPALTDAGVHLTDPLPHLDFLRALAKSRVVITDSGGLQEEASWFGVPVIVMRATTPRPEGVEIGQATLVGLHADRVEDALARLTSVASQRRIAALPCPYGDGNASDRIADALIERHRAGRLYPAEPSLPITVTTTTGGHRR